MHISADGPNSEHFHLDFPGLAAFDADFAERRVRAAALPETDPSMLDHLLSNQVIPRVLAHRGEFVIHGAAVSDGALSFLIVGPSGAGKSTLSASFHAHGFHLLGDDAIRIIQDSASLEAEAIAPTLRLYPDSIDAIGPPMEGWKPVAMGATKQQALFHDRGGVPGRITVDSILFIDPAPAQAVRISPLSPAESCADLLENSFWLDVLDPETLKAMMVRSARLCASVRAFRIAYPRDYATLDNVRGAILDRLLETEG